MLSILLPALLRPYATQFFQPLESFPLVSNCWGTLKASCAAQGEGLSFHLRPKALPRSTYKATVSLEKLINLQWSQELSLGRWAMGWSLNSGWNFELKKGSDLRDFNTFASEAAWELQNSPSQHTQRKTKPFVPAPAPQPQREPICQGSVLLEDDNAFRAEVGLSDAGLEGFIWPTNPVETYNNLSLDSILKIDESSLNEERLQLDPVLTFKFASPNKTYLHLHRPLQQSGVNIDFKPLDLEANEALECLKVGWEVFIEIEGCLNQLAEGLASSYPIQHLNKLSQVEISLPKCFFSDERFYSVPKKAFLKKLKESFGLLAYTRLAEGVSLTLPNLATSESWPVWTQVIHELESSGWLKWEEDKYPAEGFTLFRYLKSINCTFKSNSGELPTLASLKLSLSNRYFEQIELLEVPVEMPFYSKEDYEEDVNQLWPPYETTRSSMQPYEDVPWVFEKVSHLIYPARKEGEVVAKEVLDFGQALACHHQDGKMLHWEQDSSGRNAFRCPKCKTLWAPRRYQDITAQTFEKIESFTSRKQRNFCTKDLYSAYAQSKRLQFHSLIWGQDSLQLFPKVVQALARSMEGELIESCSLLDPAFEISFTLEASNGDLEKYREKEGEKRRALIGKLLMELEGVTIEEARERKNALLKTLQAGRCLTTSESLRQRASLAWGGTDPYAHQAQRSVDAREVDLHCALVIEQAIIRSALDDLEAEGNNTALVKSLGTQRTLLDSLPGNQSLESLLLGANKPSLFELPTAKPLPIMSSNGTLRQMTLALQGSKSSAPQSTKRMALKAEEETLTSVASIPPAASTTAAYSMDVASSTPSSEASKLRPQTSKKNSKKTSSLEKLFL